MAPLPVIEEEEGTEGHVKVPKDAPTVRRPGRLRVEHPDVAEFLRSPRFWRPRSPTPPSSPRASAGENGGGGGPCAL
jgi:hypothetical protein